MQNRLPSGSARTTKSGSSGKLSQPTRLAPSDTRRAALRLLPGGLVHVQAEKQPRVILRIRPAGLQREHATGLAPPAGPAPGPSRRTACPGPDIGCRGPELPGPLAIGHAQHHHAGRQHGDPCRLRARRGLKISAQPWSDRELPGSRTGDRRHNWHCQRGAQIAFDLRLLPYFRAMTLDDCLVRVILITESNATDTFP
jgi:hypothetical protein